MGTETWLRPGTCVMALPAGHLFVRSLEALRPTISGVSFLWCSASYRRTTACRPNIPIANGRRPSGLVRWVAEPPRQCAIKRACGSGWVVRPVGRQGEVEGRQVGIYCARRARLRSRGVGTHAGRGGNSRSDNVLASICPLQYTLC